MIELLFQVPDPMFKRALAVLVLSLCSVSVAAQEDTAPHWHVAQISPQHMMAVDVHGAVDRGEGVRSTMVALYFSTPKASEDGQPIDFIVFQEDFDCITPGRYRMVGGDGYIANLTKPVDTGWPENPEWKTLGPAADGTLVWNAVCVGPANGTALMGFSVHEDVLAHYRRIAHTLE